MFEEIAPRRKGIFRSVFLIILFGFVLLSLPDWVESYATPFDLPYIIALYEFVVFVVMGLMIFLFIRRYSVDCKYCLLDSVLTVKEKTGAREVVVFQASLTADTRILSIEEGEILMRKDPSLRFVSYGVSDKKSAHVITFPSVNGISAMIFQPSDKFVEVLQQLALDKQREM